MTHLLPPITQATFSDASTVAHLIAEAFFPLDASRWLVPDPDHRHAAMAGQFTILVEHALTFGHVDLLTDTTAAAVWLHYTRPLPPPVEYDQRLTRVCGVYTDRFRTLDALFEAHHPTESHHHLAMLAVAPQHQGTGRGSALLRHHHAALDQQGLPAYLEAAGIRSADLYHREGYQRHNQPFSLPNNARFYPMWRNPAQRSVTIPEPVSPGVA
jgi:GNAT superfamily N-acetyltransferase